MNRKTIILTTSIFLIVLVIGFISFYFYKQVGLHDVNPENLKSDTTRNPKMGDTNSQNEIVEFMDFKCPYCKEFHENNFKKIKNLYINKNKSDYRVVNASILGDDSIKASRAAHALYLYYPEQYWEFHEKIFEIQPNNENTWLTEDVIDRELNKLDIPKKTLKKIKIEYKKKESEAWKKAEFDKKLYNKYKNESVPSIYVNGKFIENPYNLKEILKELK